MSEDNWEMRTGQIETVLNFFGSNCSISVERTDGVTVYVQARREEDDLEIEAIGNTYLPPAARLTDADGAAMTRLGWTEPRPPTLPNFTRVARRQDHLLDVATALAATLRQVYRVSSADTWVVSPPEFGLGDGLQGFEVMDLDDVDATDAKDAETGKVEEPPAAAPAPVVAELVVDGFSPFVQEQIGWYVYLLRDPRDGSVFYVGKGKGNRVFNHAHAALRDDDEPAAQSLKLDRIRDIHAAGLGVRSEILRHHIATEPQAYTVEAAVIDTFRAIGIPLTNVVLGHRHALYGWASTGTVASIYDAPPLPEVDEPIVLLKIPQLWTPAMSDRDLFEATRGWWTVGTRALGARYALAISKGVTRAAYRIEYWRERVPGDRDYSAEDQGRRLGFWGSAAPQLGHLVNKNIDRVPQPSGGSFIYLNVDPRAQPLVPLYRADQARRMAEEEATP